MAAIRELFVWLVAIRALLGHDAGRRLAHGPEPRAIAPIAGRIGCHTFRATGIAAYLKNGGTLDRAQKLAGPASYSKTTALYARGNDEISLEEVERIVLWVQNNSGRILSKPRLPGICTLCQLAKQQSG